VKRATLCAYCDEKSTGTCRRCGAAVCGLHGAWKDGQACRRCEGAWDAARRARWIAVTPSAVIALGAGVIAAAGIAWALHAFAQVEIGFGTLGLAVGLPTALALAAVRRANAAMRARFLATPPPGGTPVRSPASPSAPPTARG
jgi:hypothetical protein